MYKEYKFRKLSRARMKAKRMKKLYGYKPSIYKVTHPTARTVFYAVVKPKGIKKVI